MPEFLLGVQLKDLDATAKDLSVDGQCTGCGECCTNVMAMSDAEISRIRAYINHHGIKPVNHFKAPFAGDFVDMCCPFLDDKKPAKKCTIYPAGALQILHVPEHFRPGIPRSNAPTHEPGQGYAGGCICTEAECPGDVLPGGRSRP